MASGGLEVFERLVVHYPRGSMGFPYESNIVELVKSLIRQSRVVPLLAKLVLIAHSLDPLCQL